MQQPAFSSGLSLNVKPLRSVLYSQFSICVYFEIYLLVCLFCAIYKNLVCYITDVFTSLSQFDIEIHYPRHWNEHQDWKVDLTACKASGYFIFHHKVFFLGKFVACY